MGMHLADVIHKILNFGILAVEAMRVAEPV